MSEEIINKIDIMFENQKYSAEVERIKAEVKYQTITELSRSVRVILREFLSSDKEVTNG